MSRPTLLDKICPDCQAVMERKSRFDAGDTCATDGGIIVYIYQCPKCKTVEVETR